MKTVLVLGGRGFIGRHIVTFLQSMGADVVIGTREAFEKQKGLRFRQVRLQNVAKLGFDNKLFEGVDVVINAVGILRQRKGETYDAVHHLAVKKLAKKCTELVLPLIHISALGLNNPVKSRFLTSKRAGEDALKASHADWIIVRPSLIDGEGGYGAKWFRRVAKWPCYLLPSSARGKLAPIHVKDLGEAIARLALFYYDDFSCQEVELGGEFQFNLPQYLQHLDGSESRLTLRIPSWFARGAAHVCDLLNATPFSYGHFELLKFDNVPYQNRTSLLLQKPCRALGCRPLNDTGCIKPKANTFSSVDFGPDFKR